MKLVNNSIRLWSLCTQGDVSEEDLGTARAKLTIAQAAATEGNHRPQSCIYATHKYKIERPFSHTLVWWAGRSASHICSSTPTWCPNVGRPIHVFLRWVQRQCSALGGCCQSRQILWHVIFFSFQKGSHVWSRALTRTVGNYVSCFVAMLNV